MIDSIADGSQVTRNQSGHDGFFIRLVNAILVSRERSAMNQIARFDPAMAAQVRQARNETDKR